MLWYLLTILYYISQCLFVCPLPLFSATAEPFVLKLAVSLRYGVGKTAKHFGTEWMYRKRFIARLRGQQGGLKERETT